mgnify:CR=1 FL=1
MKTPSFSKTTLIFQLFRFSLSKPNTSRCFCHRCRSLDRWLSKGSACTRVPWRFSASSSLFAFTAPGIHIPETWRMRGQRRLHSIPETWRMRGWWSGDHWRARFGVIPETWRQPIFQKPNRLHGSRHHCIACIALSPSLLFNAIRVHGQRTHSAPTFLAIRSTSTESMILSLPHFLHELHDLVVGGWGILSEHFFPRIQTWCG